MHLLPSGLFRCSIQPTTFAVVSKASTSVLVDSFTRLVTNPRWNAADGVGACATVAGILRRGIAQMSSELQQLRLVAALVRKLRSMQDMNEWQLQIVLQEVRRALSLLRQIPPGRASGARPCLTMVPGGVVSPYWSVISGPCR